MRVDTSDIGKDVIIIVEKNGTQKRCGITTSGRKYIEYQGNQYDLVEKQGQIDERIPEGSFSRCIFLMDVDFSSANFTGSVDFKEKHFSEHASFSHATFLEYANFSHTTFSEYANFSHTTFVKDVFFNNAIFSEQSFNEAIFSEHASFRDVSFLEHVSFRDASFSKHADFNFASFSKDVDFEFASCERVLSLRELQKSGVLNLKSAQVGKIDYYDTTIDQAANRETFLVLKNLAIDQQDQVKALDFHVQEMEMYRKSLSWKKFDWWLLDFEKFTSSYGTKPWQPLLWIIFFQGLMLTFMFPLFTNGALELTEYLSSILGYKFWSHESLEPLQFSEYFQENSLLSLGSLKLINSLKNIGTVVLLYELIKSFRKFSRKL